MLINWSLQDLVKQQVVQAPSSSVTKAVMIEEDSKKQPEYPKPDVEQMLPFKPKAIVGKNYIDPLVLLLPKAFQSFDFELT